jgi:hypothetical protein
VRSRQYLVEDVVPPPAPGQSTLVRLSCLADDALGERLEVLWEHEVDAQVRDGKAAWEIVSKRGFDDPRLFSAYLNTLRWNCVTATDPKLFQAPYRAGIEVKTYQLEPLRKALQMPRVNLFIADDVGLGKTIEAGLILREMILRQKVRRVLVCCPPSVVRQWQEEMEQRFGLTFVIYDREFVARCRQERGYSVNPWTTHSRFVISQALIREEPYAAPLRGWLEGSISGTMLILDEAHNVAPASGAKYAIDSHLTRAIQELAPLFEHRLFLSATPHNGHSNSFASLLEILDPQRFCRGVPVKSHKLLEDVMVRRLKSDLREIGESFPERKVVPIVIKGLPEDAPELSLSRMLQAYRRLREQRLSTATKKQQSAARLVVTSLQKRLLSSIEAFARTLEVHRRSVERDAEKAAEVEIEDLPLLAGATGADDERADLAEEEVEAEEDAEMAAASRATAGTSDAMKPEIDLLNKMRAIANGARSRPDARLEWLIEWVRTNLCPNLGKKGAAWLDRRVLIFTEYADTKRYLEELLRAAAEGSDRDEQRITTFHGGIGEERREAIKAAFNMDPTKHPLRILIATDAAREGINLQNNCADLFHFDVPWNPSRMEQRNGRIDRTLQRAPVVWCRYFVLPQRAEDRVLEVLVEKTGKIQAELGSLSPVIERRVDQLFARGIRAEDEDLLKGQLRDVDRPEAGTEDAREVVKEEFEGTRKRQQELLEQLDELKTLQRRAKEWIGLDVRHFRDAISASLEIAGGTDLKPIDAKAAAKEPDTATYVVPSLHERKGADPTWAATLDTLRAPRKKGQSEGEWRSQAPIRPVVFQDPKSLDGNVVHLHLEHRLVQRLLGRFLSQGFVNDDISRACIVRTHEAEPRVVVFGRLALYGNHAARLHDEVISVAADWEDPRDRGRRRLKPLLKDERERTLHALEDALVTPHLQEVPEPIRKLLLASAPKDVAELAPHLERRAREVAESAASQLEKRGEREAVAMQKILEAQRDRIGKHSKEIEKQLPLFLQQTTDDERRQLEYDRRHWDSRLRELQRELIEEPKRVQSSYVVRAQRIEPVGIVFLWPVSR